MNNHHEIDASRLKIISQRAASARSEYRAAGDALSSLQDRKNRLNLDIDLIDRRHVRAPGEDKTLSRLKSELSEVLSEIERTKADLQILSERSKEACNLERRCKEYLGETR